MVGQYGENGQIPQNELPWMKGQYAGTKFRSLRSGDGERELWGEMRNALVELRLFYIEGKYTFTSAFFVYGESWRIWLFGQLYENEGPPCMASQ